MQPPLMDILSSLVRGVIIAPPGKKLVVADLSNIEGRMLAWLAGEAWKLQAFRDFDNGIGADLYKLAYAKAFQVPVEEVNKDQRQIGKILELMLGFGGGTGAFLTGAASYGFDIEDLAARVYGTLPEWAREEAHEFYAWSVKQKRSTYGLSERAFVVCDSLKRMWRAAHPNTEALWKGLQEACLRAVEHPGTTLPCKRVKVRRDGAWLRIQLPSGRALCYPQPKIEDGQLTYMGVHQYTRKWTRLRTYGGKLCISGGTLVLTYRGWIPIETVDALDLVWDGVEWVRTEGCIGKGVQEVIEAYGASMTPDHLVLSMEGWICASQSERHQRAACRIPYGCEIPRQRRRPEVSVVGSLRLRNREDHAGERTAEAESEGDHLLVRVHEEGHHRGEEHHARHERPPCILGVAQHDRSLPPADASGLGELWRARDNGLRTLAGVFRELLGGHVPDVREGARDRPGRQQQGVHPGELPLGDPKGAGEQQAQQQIGGGQDGLTAGGGTGGEGFDYVLPAGSGSAAGETRGSPRRVAQVFDLLDCGPRHRFVIWAGGGPLIVHNCENITQAAARDVLAGSMLAAEAAGYSIILTIHDELVTETPDSPEFSDEGLSEIMARSPEWAPDIPLAAAGFEAYRYRK